MKRLKSVRHSIAHHAVSGLSYVHPHLRQACSNANLVSLTIDLKKESPCPKQFRNIEPLKLSLEALHNKFIDILESEGFTLEDIIRCNLLFEFPEEYKDDYCSNCHAFIESSSGQHFFMAVDYMGNTIEPNKNIA